MSCSVYGLSTSHLRPSAGRRLSLFVFEREQMLTAFDRDLLRAEVDPLWTLQHRSPVQEDACRTVREQPDLVFAARLAVQEPVPGDSRRVCTRERAKTFDGFRRRAPIELGVDRRSPRSGRDEHRPGEPGRAGENAGGRRRAGRDEQHAGNACARADAEARHVGRCRCADDRTAGTSAPRGRRRCRRPKSDG